MQERKKQVADESI